MRPVFNCTNCDAQYPKWEGRCRQCGQWGKIVANQQHSANKTDLHPPQLIDLAKLDLTAQPRLQTASQEFNRVLGGGIVPGSVVLVGGAPGIGKSTLLLQLAASSAPSYSLPSFSLYVSGEESAAQVKLRLSRLNQSAANLQFAGETNTEKICTAIRTTNPIFAIIDSIQTLRSDESNSTAGSLPQVSISCAKLIETAKQKNIPIFIIGHITKQGLVAGPKTLEHLVDTVLYLEGDKNHFYRLLRCVKNRFGSIDEIGVFEMTEKGLIDVPNPSSVFLQNFDATASGTVATVIMEGTRPFSVEIQALTTKTYFGYPKRTASGFKESRLELIIAVLSKRLNLKLSEQDVYLNVAGGLKITEPAADLAVALAIISSYKNQPLDQRLCAFGEIGLAGEIRPVPLIDRRLREAENLGFLKAICPPVKFKPKDKLQITEIKNITEHT